MLTFLQARWQDIVMVNYEVPESVLKPYLPFGVELDLFGDKALISLVGFKFLDSTIFRIPIPYYGSFCEINLRFYVRRKVGDQYRRGVVFIGEAVPYKIVSFLANSLFKEHYQVAAIKHLNVSRGAQKTLDYLWNAEGCGHAIQARFNSDIVDIGPGSQEEFIYEHYYGYTKAGDGETWEYRVNHPAWQVNTLIDYEITCNFEKMYGESFAFLNHRKPLSVFNAIGSGVTIDWHINKIKR